jgi:acyl-CoA synthetase (AMP-forming)/AMP-acid ligase II
VPPQTLSELLRAQAIAHPNRGYRYLGDGATVSESLSYAELHRDACRISTLLARAHVAPASRALLLYPPGLAFVSAFWGCFQRGVIAVPVPPPTAGRNARALVRLHAVATDCAADVVLTSLEFEATARAALAGLPALADTPVLVTDRLEGNAEDDAATASPDDIAVLQYTSGSTRTPRGVMVTHANLLHNLELLGTFHRDASDVVMVSWLPLYHDMGLIRGMMSPLASGGDCIMMSPLHFVQRPAKWLAAVTRFRATITGAPNFGYELCVRKIPEADLARFDLAALRVAFCTAEPIRHETVRRFLERFAACGLSPTAFRPAYGLAENTVAVCGELGNGPKSWRVKRTALRNGSFEIAGEAVPDAETNQLVSCGEPLGDQTVVIVDEEKRPAEPGSVGEVWIRGRSVGKGYFRKPEETRDVFGAHLADGSGPFLRTGDLGCVDPSGGLCITGRKKDLIIVRGQNYYPQDIEATIERATARARPGCSAAFAIEEEDAIVVAIEVSDAACSSEVVDAVRNAVREDHEVGLSAICLLAEGGLPKTASGKVQRAATRQAFLDRSLPLVHTWTEKDRATSGIR